MLGFLLGVILGALSLTQVESETVGVTAPVTGYYCQRTTNQFVGDGGGYCGLTASGVQVHRGTAACGSWWGLGTILWVVGHGIVTCEDTGYLSPIQVDIFFHTNQEMIDSIVMRQRTHRVVLLYKGG